jgi:2'-5' RNA ligase
VVPAHGLDRLAGAVRAATARFGDPVDPMPFVGHLTLARARGRRALPADLGGRPVTARWEAPALSVVRSHRGDRAPRYGDVATLPFGGPPGRRRVRTRSGTRPPVR